MTVRGTAKLLKAFRQNYEPLRQEIRILSWVYRVQYTYYYADAQMLIIAACDGSM